MDFNYAIWEEKNEREKEAESLFSIAQPSKVYFIQYYFYKFSVDF